MPNKINKGADPSEHPYSLENWTEEDGELGEANLDEIEGGARSDTGGLNPPKRKIKVVFEQVNHHEGSIYCVDWSRTERLIATGSNDK